MGKEIITEPRTPNKPIIPEPKKHHYQRNHKSPCCPIESLHQEREYSNDDKSVR